ncbi:MAG: glycosyltransferase family 4 protein [Planctomycetota bacterium]
MKVAFVNHTFAESNGQGRVNSRVLRAAVDRGWDVTAIGSKLSDELRSREGLRSIEIVPARAAKGNLLGNYSFAARAERVLRRQSHDVVISNGGMLHRPVDLCLCHFVHRFWIRNDQHAYRSRGGLYGSYQWAYSKVGCRWEADAYRKAKSVVAVSELVRDQLINDVGIDAGKITVIENGIDDAASRPTDAAENLRRELGIAPDAFVLFFAGELRTPRKNFDVLLQALKRLPQDVVVIAAGAFDGGPYRKLVSDFGLDSRVHFLGHRNDVCNLYAAGDVYVCMSHYDPFPIVTCEAMAVGVPVVVASTVGSAGTVLRHGCGVVINDPRDAQALADACRQLQLAPERRAAMKQNALAAAEHMSWRAKCEAYLQLIESTRDAPRRADRDQVSQRQVLSQAS